MRSGKLNYVLFEVQLKTQWKFSLKNVCGVQEFHPMMDNYYCDNTNVGEMARRVEQTAKKATEIYI